MNHVYFDKSLLLELFRNIRKSQFQYNKLKLKYIIKYSIIGISFIFILLSLNLFAAFGQVENKIFNIVAAGDLGYGDNGQKLYHQYKILNQI